MPKLSRRQAIFGACAAFVAGVLPVVVMARLRKSIPFGEWRPDFPCGAFVSFDRRICEWVMIFDGRVYVAWKNMKTGAMWWTKPTLQMVEEVDAYHAGRW